MIIIIIEYAHYVHFYDLYYNNNNYVLSIIRMIILMKKSNTIFAIWTCYNQRKSILLLLQANFATCK